MATDEATERREALIADLERRDALHDPAVRAAMRAVPRHHFLPDETLERAYADAAIPTKFAGDVSISSASQPAIVALMLEQLGVAPGMRVLEIGAGTGYNAALLRTLVGPSGHVTTVDIDEDITEAARLHLATVGIADVDVITGDGAAGYPANAPYDRVILTVGAGDIAPAWPDQLRPGGILVLPLRIGPGQFSIAFTKDGGVLRSMSLQPCGFMPLRGSMGDDATGSHIARPAPGLTVSLTNADATAAESIAALLGQPSVTRAIPALAQGWFSALALALSAPDRHRVFAFVSVDDACYGFTGHGYGVFDLAILGAVIIPLQMDGTADTTVRSYGDPAVTDWLVATLSAWASHGAPRPSDFHITATPRGVAQSPPSAPTYETPHWSLRIERA